MAADRVDTVVNLAKRRGFVYPCSEIYGGTRSAWDYGPLGVELKENVKRQWWRSMVQRARRHRRPRLRGHPGPRGLGGLRPRRHLHRPADRVRLCHKRFRADHLEEAYEAKHGRAPEDGLADINCPNCGNKGTFTEPRSSTPDVQDPPRPGRERRRRSPTCARRPRRASSSTSRTCRRPSRKKPPFGIAQIGKSLPQRDHARQLHLPHPRVRADGDGVLRQAGRATRSGTSTGCRSAGTGTSTSACAGEPALLRAPARRSCRTTRSAPSTSSTASSSAARSSPSWRASPTAPTST